MKYICFACLVFGASFAVNAQTNPAPLISGTNAAPAVVPGAQMGSPNEIRTTEIQSTNGFWFFTKSNVAVYLGDVRVDNPQMKLRCELLTVEAPKWTNGTYNRATAETNVVIDWIDNKQTNHATSDKAVYTYIVTNLANGATGSHFETNSTVVLSGNPTVTDPSGTFQGDPIFFNRITGVIQSPNMRRMVISNSPNATATSAFQPSKTNATAK